MCVALQFTIFVSLASDINVNQADLFPWRPSRKDGPMKIEDACITYTPKQEGDNTEEEEWKSQRKGRILGLNPIPRFMGEYSFTISCSTPIQDFAVGFTSKESSVVYEGGLGVISKEFFINNTWIEWKFTDDGFWRYSYRKKQISSVEKTNINDTIECCLLYQTFRERKYAIVQIIKNSQLISSQALETELVWPVIQIGSPQTTIDTNPNSQGTASHDMSGILIKK